MFIILSLIILIAAFNIISGLTILVKNKTRDIAILKSIGVQNSSIAKIFFIVGLTIGAVATFVGIILGIILSINIESIRSLISDLFNISLFSEEIYFLSKMPTEIEPFSIFLISLFSIFITCLVSIYPAIKASKLDTIKSLKYE
jgi:lipoprotein-releasing system permease protein